MTERAAVKLEWKARLRKWGPRCVADAPLVRQLNSGRSMYIPEQQYEQFLRLASAAGVFIETSVPCGRCTALPVAGRVEHEAGCPNAKHECQGCNVPVPARAQYCWECI